MQVVKDIMLTHTLKIFTRKFDPCYIFLKNISSVIKNLKSDKQLPVGRFYNIS